MTSFPGPIVSQPLQRRLHKRLEHGVLALLAIAACAGLALMAARPLSAPGGDAAAAGLPVQATPATHLTADVQATQRKRTHVRRSRQTLAMPYFSFAAGN